MKSSKRAGIILVIIAPTARPVQLLTHRPAKEVPNIFLIKTVGPKISGVIIQTINYQQIPATYIWYMYYYS